MTKKFRKRLEVERTPRGVVISVLHIHPDEHLQYDNREYKVSIRRLHKLDAWFMVNGCGVCSLDDKGAVVVWRHN